MAEEGSHFQKIYCLSNQPGLKTTGAWSGMRERKSARAKYLVTDRTERPSTVQIYSNGAEIKQLGGSSPRILGVSNQYQCL